MGVRSWGDQGRRARRHPASAGLGRGLIVDGRARPRGADTQRTTREPTQGPNCCRCGLGGQVPVKRDPHRWVKLCTGKRTSKEGGERARQNRKAGTILLLPLLLGRGLPPCPYYYPYPYSPTRQTEQESWDHPQSPTGALKRMATDKMQWPTFVPRRSSAACENAAPHRAQPTPLAYPTDAYPPRYPTP